MTEQAAALDAPALNDAHQGVASHLSGPARWLLIAGAASLVLRLAIANSLAVTGDEAFFYWWGVFPAWGYSDHPPMVGWLIAATRALFGDTLFAIRLPVVLLPLAIGAALWWGFSALDRTRVAWGIALFWLTPFSWLSVLITTDTPLIFWSALSAAALARAESRPKLDGASWRLYALAGLFLGCAFLSKYFAALIGMAYAVYFLLLRRDRLAPFALLLVCALPGPLINLAWNMSHGWPNIMFNLYNRNEGEAFELRKPVLYAATLAYLATPAVLWFGWRYRGRLAPALRSAPATRLAACLVGVPFAVFLLLSGQKVIGLHWLLAFYPFVFLLLALVWPADALRGTAWGLSAFTAVHVALVLTIFATNFETWRTTPLLSRIYPDIVRSYRAADIVKQVARLGTVLMAEAYTGASIYGFARREYMPVFGVGRFHARQDDQLVDFSVYQGKTIRVLLSGKTAPPDYALYFDLVRTESIEQDGISFYLMEGVNFNYAAYRQGVLGKIHDRFYNVPAWLPMTGCPFCKRYCGQVRCVRQAPLPEMEAAGAVR
jgi:4-amino-4-deoxy-L-arabinose transferase-like glycosyltransferase